MSNPSPLPAAESSTALPSRWARLWRHLWVTDWQLRRALPPGALDHLQSTISAGEELHTAQVRFIVEADLDLLAVWRGQTPRERALELFAQYHLWDTAANNGVLVYVQFADRAVVDAIVKETAPNQHGVRSILEAIIVSPVFLNK